MMVHGHGPSKRSGSRGTAMITWEPMPHRYPPRIGVSQTTPIPSRATLPNPLGQWLVVTPPRRPDSIHARGDHGSLPGQTVGWRLGLFRETPGADMAENLAVLHVVGRTADGRLWHTMRS